MKIGNITMFYNAVAVILLGIGVSGMFFEPVSGVGAMVTAGLFAIATKISPEM